MITFVMLGIIIFSAIMVALAMVTGKWVGWLSLLFLVAVCVPALMSGMYSTDPETQDLAVQLLLGSPVSALTGSVIGIFLVTFFRDMVLGEGANQL